MLNTNTTLLNVISSDVSAGWVKESELVCQKMIKLFNQLSLEEKQAGFLEISDADLRNDLHNEGKSILSNIEIQAKNDIETELGHSNMDGLANASFTFVI